jgi:hypothetical protein
MTGPTNRRVQFGTINPGEKRRQSPRGRICDSPGCSTVLSIYNASQNCSAHDPLNPRFPRPLS